MKKSNNNNNEITLAEVHLQYKNILTSHQKLWELIFKLDKDILAVNEVVAHLLLEYKSIRTFETQFIKTYGKTQGEPKPKPKRPDYPFGI